MKKEYLTPDFKIVSILMKDALAASQYVPTAEVPTRDGSDDGWDDF